MNKIVDKPFLSEDTTRTRWLEDTKLHRLDGPAVEWSDGGEEWYFEGNRHREGGPAVEWAGGRKSWYLNGKQYTEEEFALLQFMNRTNIYMEE